MVAIYLVLAFLAGAMVTFQVGINARLAHFVHGPIRAALISFVVGMIALLILTLVFWRPLPSAQRLGEAPWWAWIGGLLGAFYVAMSIVTGPRLGAATLIAAVVAGQAVAAVLIDQFGWVGFRVHHVSPGRIVGMSLVLGGIALVRIF